LKILDSEECLCSINELIYSFREYVTSPFPGLSSEEAIVALETIKYIKDRFSLGIYIYIYIYFFFFFLKLKHSYIYNTIYYIYVYIFH